jgi:hypothetical protein
MQLPSTDNSKLQHKSKEWALQLDSLTGSTAALMVPLPLLVPKG